MHNHKLYFTELRNVEYNIIYCGMYLVDPLLSNDHEMSNDTTAVTK
jgi:hypothetical protein